MNFKPNYIDHIEQVPHTYRVLFSMMVGQEMGNRNGEQGELLVEMLQAIITEMQEYFPELERHEIESQVLDNIVQAMVMSKEELKEIMGKFIGDVKDKGLM